jgi:hypothetical protein
MTPSGLKDVELVRHRCRGHCRRGAEAGSKSETQVPRPMWDRGTELSQNFRGLSTARRAFPVPRREKGPFKKGPWPAPIVRAGDRTRTGDPHLGKVFS